MIDLIGLAKTVVGPVLAAAVSGFFSWHGGKREGHADFINAVEKAASTVINRLKDQLDSCVHMHKECEQKYDSMAEKYNELSKSVEILMAEKVPVYSLNTKGDSLD